MESVLKTLSSCNIVREAMVASLNRAALEAYWLGLNLVVSIELLLFSSKDCIGNNLRRCKFPRGTLHALTFFKSTYIIQALTSNYYGSGIEHTLWLFGSSLDTPPHITLAFLKLHDTADSPNSL